MELHLPETDDVESVWISVSQDGRYVVLEQDSGYEVLIERKYLPDVIAWLTQVMEAKT